MDSLAVIVLSSAIHVHVVIIIFEILFAKSDEIATQCVRILSSLIFLIGKNQSRTITKTVPNESFFSFFSPPDRK